MENWRLGIFQGVMFTESLRKNILSSSSDEFEANQHKWTYKFLKNGIAWFKYYFMQKQNLLLENGAADIDSNASFYARHRKHIAYLLPMILVNVIWLSFMLSRNRFDLFVEDEGNLHDPYYYMSIVMIFGSMIGGATSEGGGAIAFPVLTLIFSVQPSVARDFTFMIQSIGMSSASVTILLMRIRIEWRSLIYSTIGGTIGVIFGLEYIAPNISAAYEKMYFVSIWFSFAIALFLLNFFDERKVFACIPHWQRGDLYRYLLFPTGWEALPEVSIVFNWRAVALIVIGFIGGIFSSIAGTGLDICSFAMLTLLFRVNERVASPTSVLLMSINTIIAFFYRCWIMQAISQEA